MKLASLIDMATELTDWVLGLSILGSPVPWNL